MSGCDPLLACFNLHSNDLCYYARNYKLAADSLISSVKERDVAVDSVVYPVLFLVRHQFELGLKELLALVNRLNESESSIPFTHKLQILWDSIQPRIDAHRNKIGSVTSRL